MSYTSLLIDTCTVQRFSEGAQDAYGAPVLTWSDNLSDIACRLQDGNGVELKVGTEIVVADFKLFLGDVDITEQDRVVIGTVTYEILLAKELQDGFNGHHKEVFLRVAR